MGSLSIQLSVDNPPRADRVQVGPPVEEKPDPAAAEPDRKRQREPEVEIMEASDQPAGNPAKEGQWIWLDGHLRLDRLNPDYADHAEIVRGWGRAFQKKLGYLAVGIGGKNDSRPTPLPSPMRQRNRRECAKLTRPGQKAGRNGYPAGLLTH